jgi:hypothetical protein
MLLLRVAVYKRDEREITIEDRLAKKYGPGEEPDPSAGGRDEAQRFG